MSNPLKKIVIAALATVLLSACGGEFFDVKLVARVPSTSFIGQRVEIQQVQPQVLFRGRGYSFVAELTHPNIGFDVITLPLAIRDVQNAAHDYCHLLNGEISKFINFSEAFPGTRTLRLYFNREYVPTNAGL